MRPFLVWVVVLALLSYSVPEALAAHPAIGILTLATHAHLNKAAAFPGLSVFEGERLSTEAEGRLGLRAGRSILTLVEQTEVQLIPLDGGLHVDMSAGSVHFSAAENEFVEMHALDAMVRPAGSSATQALVTILGPNVLQLTAELGALEFRCRDEFRNLPEGQTYRIYLDGPTGSSDSGTGSENPQKPGKPPKATYYIVGVGVAGAAAWGIHEALRSENGEESPASREV